MSENMWTDFEYICPVDPLDELDGLNLFHSHYVVCHRHKLIHFYYGGAWQIYPEDKPETVAYWEETLAQVNHYQQVPFPLERSTRPRERSKPSEKVVSLAHARLTRQPRTRRTV